METALSKEFCHRNKHFTWDDTSDPDDTSGITVQNSSTLIAGGTSTLDATWDSEEDTVSLTGITSSNEAIATIGATNGSNGTIKLFLSMDSVMENQTLQ